MAVLDNDFPLVDLESVSRRFGNRDAGTAALSEINLRITDGEYVVFSGPSGCGKTTLLSIIGLLDEPSGGRYCLGGRDAGRLTGEEKAALRNTQIGFVFQNFHLIGDLNVSQNVELPLLPRYGPGRERSARVDEALERVGMGGFAKRLPSELSGGQQQRVAIARAIAGKPRLLLADEPTGNLDTRSGEAVMDLLQQFVDANKTVCVVTHDPRLAAQAQRVVHLLDGRIVDETG